ncbi:MAG: tRNA uridine-5-carboxymethylaminomethyl(34) synthesis GTPase MnmE [Armatimonadetes bacterium]|nr:tRNA uridine-5-carboxymethylaminomethyl(34) synthesis GTPase MnmE [Armatimonadota bacterium]
MLEDTIVALSTPWGESAIGIIRLSGSKTQEIFKNSFIPINGKLEIIPRKQILGYIWDKEKKQKIDQVVACFTEKPNSYTGEDVLEIYAHGGLLLLKKILALFLKHGTRLAQKGEFTKRAFLNKKIDLSQAEAVIDLIKAKSEKGINLALEQLKGGISQEIKDLRKEILNSLAHLEASMDFPEEVSEISYLKLTEESAKWLNKITNLIDSFEQGKIFKEGFFAAIAGKPNVGKSTLLNKLLKQERAIVTDIPGTTRDRLEEWIDFYGIPLKLIDTAGIRKSEDFIEKIGIEKSWEAVLQADIVLLVLDASRELSIEDQEILEKLNHKKKILILNKIDLGEKINYNTLLNKSIIIKTSLIKNLGLRELEEELKRITCIEQNISEKVITNLRHKEALEKAGEFILNLKDSLERKFSEEFLSLDLRGAIGSLEEITGENLQGDLLEQIFSQFCIGK